MAKFPKYLIKAFDKCEYAKQLASGRVCFRTLEFYRKLEDEARKDSNEGKGSLQIPGEKLSVNLINKTIQAIPGLEDLAADAIPENHFIYCFSASDDADITKVPTKFGTYCVVIENPANFLEQIKIAVDAHPVLSRNLPDVDAKAVSYDRGATKNSRPSEEEIQYLTWAQKSLEFESEREFRFHFSVVDNQFLFGPKKDYIYLDLDMAMISCYIKLRPQF